MNPYLATKYTVMEGYGHPLFSLVHMATLLFIAVFITFFLRFYMKCDEKKRSMILKVIAVLLLIDELVKDVNAIITGQWNWNLLPLHLCSVNIFIIFIDAFRPSSYARNYLYAVCIPASISALVFPSWMTSLPYWGLMSMHSWTVHIMLLLYPLLLLGGGFVPSLHCFLTRRVLVPFALFLAFDYFFNYAFNTDFFFLRNGGEDNPLSFFESILPDPLYLMFVIFLLALMVSFMYLIAHLVKKYRKA